MELSEAIHAIRVGEKMTQREFAAAIRRAVRTVGGWERGETTPHIGDLRKMATRLGYDSWESLLAKHVSGQHPTPSGHAGMIPVLAKIPAGFGSDGEVADAYDFEEAIDYMPGTFRDASDPRMFGLVVEGDSMASKYPAGCYISCSPQHWRDHGFAEGFCYAVRLSSGETTVKRVHLLENGRRLELAPINPAHPTVRVRADEVVIAALVRGSYTKEPLPG